MSSRIEPTGVETFFGRDEIIVSKTDPRGRVTYANRVFLRVAGYEEHEVLGKAHSIVRHPDMPRSVFKLLWDTIEGGREIFAYVKNMAKSGDHYWVFAHVTPTFDDRGAIVGYHSNRRCPERTAIAAVAPLYDALLQEERRAGGGREGMLAATAVLQGELGKRGIGYDEFAFTL